MADKDSPTAPPASTPPLRSQSAPSAESVAPSIRDHAERLKLAPWQVAAVLARMCGEHDEDGARVYPDGASLNTRIAVADFDGALDVALTGRI